MVALGLFWVALPAMASVTLGEIEVRSSLNQPLDAEIRVDGSSAGAPGLTIRVAPEVDYRRVGLTRGAVPPDLVIAIDGTGASRVVRLSTQRPVREPYIGLLLEASWSGGRTLREYTLLLDPPLAFAPARSTAPVLSEAPPAAVRAEPPVATAPAGRPRADVHRVNRGDTLFRIVQGMGYTGVTDQQVMLAILETNPDGFIDRNINQLRADVTLTLPTEAEVAQRNPVLARQEVQRQIEGWRARMAPAPPTVALAPRETPAAPPPPEQVQPEPSAQPATPSEEPQAVTAPVVEVEPVVPATVPEGVDDSVAGVSEEPVVVESLEDSEPVPADRLEILADSALDLAAAPTPASARILEEALLSQQSAMDALRDEVVSLRTELGERDQLLSVVNTELARLEERMRGLQGQAPAAGAASFGDQPLHQRILAEPLLLIMAGALLLLLLLLLLALFRRPQREVIQTHPNKADMMAAADPAPGMDDAERSKVRSGVLAGVTTGAGMASASAIGSGSAEQAYAAAGDPDTSEDDVPDSLPEDRAGEEDVLADVELYLAYGMNEQAISTLEHAINEGHDSLLYRVRLLEAHGANGDADAVRQQAGALRAELGPDDADWLSRIAAVESMVPQTSGAGAPPDSGTTDALPAAFDSSEDSGLTWDPVPEGAALEAPEDPGELNLDSSESIQLESPPTEAGGGSRQAIGETSEEGLLQFNLEELEMRPGWERDSADTPSQGTEESTSDLPPLVFTDAEEAYAGLGPTGPERASPSTTEDFSEVGMKLNLAEAFAEMGDREGALALLNEIGSNGTEEQRAKLAEVRSKLDPG
jgi:pilus assembly protein FimV